MAAIASFAVLTQKKGPLLQRCQDSRWKCRQFAFEELAAALGTADEKMFDEYAGLWKKIVSVRFVLLLCVVVRSHVPLSDRTRMLPRKRPASRR